MKKLLSILLLVGILLTMAPIAFAESEPVELHFITRRRGEAYEENQVKQIIEEKFNCKIKWEILPSEGYNDACSVILASGDYPDMMEYQASASFYTTEVPLLAEDGVLAPLNELLETYGQNILAERPDGKWLWVDDERYTIPCRPANVPEHYLTIRQDWLDNLGLEMPTTLDELKEVARAFTFDDPDQDGVDDTYGLGLVIHGGVEQVLSTVAGSFGVYYDWMPAEDGSYVPWQLTDNALAAAKFIRELYEMGVVDPEFTTDVRERALEKKSLDTYGIEYWALTQTGDASAWWNTFKTNVPHAECAVLPLIEVEGYDTVWTESLNSDYNVATGSFQLMIFDECENKDVVMQIINYLASDEGADLVTLGPKGVTWDEDENGNYVALDVDNETIKQSGRELYYVVYWHNVYKKNSDPLVLEGLEMLQPYLVTKNNIVGTWEGDSEALTNLLKTHMISILTDSSVDPDAQFQIMKDEYMAMGGADYIAWYNENVEA